MWIGGRAYLVIGGTVDVFTPLRHIAIEITDPPTIGFLLPDRMGLLVRIIREPSVLTELIGLAEIVWVVGAGAAGILPFRFRGQPIAIGRVIAFPIRGLFVVAGFETFEQRTLVA